MAKKIKITEAQWNYIMECNGIDPNLINEELGGATTCGSVGAETTRGDVGYDAPAFDSKKNKEFWKGAMTHNKKGGISCDRLDKDGKEPVDEDLRHAAVGAAMGAASLLGGGMSAKAQPMTTMPSAEQAKTISVLQKYGEDELKKMFPQAYRDRAANPEVWKRHFAEYEGTMPIDNDERYSNKKLYTACRAAKEGKNPWDAVLYQYSDWRGNNGKTVNFNDVR